MSKRLVGLVVAVVVVLIIVGVWVGVKLTQPADQKASAYTAVYLTSGDVYFGKLRWFPWPHLKDVWLLQQGVGADGKAQFGVVPFTSAFWGPTNKVYLNMREVLFWAHVRADSEIAKGMENPAAVQQQQQAALQQQQLQQQQQAAAEAEKKKE